MNKNITTIQCATNTVSVSVSANILVLVSLSVSADTDFYIGSLPIRGNSKNMKQLSQK